ncbi:MAG: family 10 glycosylhydrolase [Gemmatimonadaceae bacterium]|nr:family 10 glycosylhydrolase [Gemmatimonadaceae bacterium]
MSAVRRLRGVAAGATLAVCAACSGSDGTAPPPPPWIATVFNIDWPSRSTLGVAEQQGELRALLDRAAALRMNAVVLQVRSTGDALYPSTLEPWSRVLTGAAGRDPGWDPLAFAVTEAHARGLQLHAWINPFRAASDTTLATLAPLHFARRRPELAPVVGTQRWFDPGEEAVQDHVLAVARDIVSRYAVDGLHLDDFFYPYPSASWPNTALFPDSAAWTRYLATAGASPLSRADWRRRNIDRFIERLYTELHVARPTLVIGISPFGIWRPGNPSGVTGLDYFTECFADSRRWLQQGWVDYLAPQLYWSLASTGQPFGALLDWWRSQSVARRHVWPGLAAYRVSDNSANPYAPAEIPAQVAAVRARSGWSDPATSSGGVLLYNATAVRLNRGGLADSLGGGAWRDAAWMPAMPWLDAAAPAAPATLAIEANGTRLRWSAASDADVRWYAVQWRSGIERCGRSTLWGMHRRRPARRGEQCDN